MTLWQCTYPNDMFETLLINQPSHSSKAYLEQVLAQAKVKVSATSSTWEPQRAYERRLTNIMSKIKGLLQKSSTLCAC